MIVHRYPDGSEGIEYQIGDKVIVDSTIAGGWFNFGPTHSDNCTVQKVEKNTSWHTARLYIHFSPEWGPAECYPWMIKPTNETRNAATLEVAEQ